MLAGARRPSALNKIASVTRGEKYLLTNVLEAEGSVTAGQGRSVSSYRLAILFKNHLE
jgi:hypothetical protein